MLSRLIRSTCLLTLIIMLCIALPRVQGHRSPSSPQSIFPEMVVTFDYDKAVAMQVTSGPARPCTRRRFAAPRFGGILKAGFYSTACPI